MRAGNIGFGELILGLSNLSGFGEHVLGSLN